MGDTVSGALQPRETVERLISLELPTIMGNHERQLLVGDPARMGRSDRFAYEALLPSQRKWLADLPETLWLQKDILLVHGSPRSDMEYMLETVIEGGCRAAAKVEIAERVGEVQAQLILCGHSHIPRAARLNDGRLILNPGSVGLQAYEDTHPFPHRMENGSPHARYAIVENVKGEWKADFRQIAYDWVTASEEAKENGRNDWYDPLLTGYVDGGAGTR